MAKKTGTKHHALIKLEELNKIFSEEELIPIPKGYLKHISWKLSAHNVDLKEVPKDVSNPLQDREIEENTKTELQVILPNEFSD